jgi:hypothetical protein
MKKFHFIGWQRHAAARGEVFTALFNLNDPRSKYHQSTVSFSTLVTLGYMHRVDFAHTFSMN